MKNITMFTAFMVLFVAGRIEAPVGARDVIVMMDKIYEKKQQQMNQAQLVNDVQRVAELKVELDVLEENICRLWAELYGA